MTPPSENHFPFSALEGQQALQMALLLTAIDPMIGGVLIDGPRGTAKSTAARGLADLLDAARLVNLPLTASEEHVIGSLNIASALQEGQVEFKPGLLQAAHNGVLYIDEVNLLPDHLVDALLDVSASGINRIERDGISHQHPARFVLVGTMNPEEGQLRPQLLDRFGLYISLPTSIEPELRQRIVKARLAFDSNPEHFIAEFATQQNTLKQRLRQAREGLNSIDYTDQVIRKITELCHYANVEGLRADLSLLRAARAHAAWQQRIEICQEDIAVVQAWVLAHREKDAHDNPPQAAHNTASSKTSSNNAHPNSPSSNETAPPDKPSSPIMPQAADSGKPDATDTDHLENQNWGAMPSQTPGMTPFKNLKALSTKK